MYDSISEFALQVLFLFNLCLYLFILVDAAPPTRDQHEITNIFRQSIVEMSPRIYKEISTGMP